MSILCICVCMHACSRISLIWILILQKFSYIAVEENSPKSENPLQGSARMPVCLSASVVPYDPCLILQQILRLLRLQRKHKRTLMPLNQQAKEISKWNTPLISCAAQAWEQ